MSYNNNNISNYYCYGNSFSSTMYDMARRIEELSTVVGTSQTRRAYVQTASCFARVDRSTQLYYGKKKILRSRRLLGKRAINTRTR